METGSVLGAGAGCARGGDSASWVPAPGARGGDRVPVRGAGCGRGGAGRWCWLCAWQTQGAGAGCRQANMVAHALIPKLWMWLLEFCEQPYALVCEDDFSLKFDRVLFWKRMSKVCR